MSNNNPFNPNNGSYSGSSISIGTNSNSTVGIAPQTVTTTGTSGLWQQMQQGGGQWTIPNSAPYQPTWDYGSGLSDMLRSYRQPISSAIPVGEHFMCLQGSFEIRAHGESHQLVNVLDACKNIKYMKVNSEVILPKPVWDALFTYMKGEDAYAGLHPSEFLDKIFAPKETCESK